MVIERQHAVGSPARKNPAEPSRERLQVGIPSRQAGRPLPLAEQQSARWLGDDFDFTKVRIHTDGHAAAMSVALNADAFTVGPDIFFAANRYAPRSERGGRLLRHELTHVVQQRNVRISGDWITVGAPSTDAEAEARAIGGDDGMRRSPVSHVLGSEAVVQCDGEPAIKPSDVQPRSVAAAIALLKQARELALGIPHQDERALAIVDDVYRFLEGFLRDDMIRAAFKGHSFLNIMYAHEIVGEAKGGVSIIRSFFRMGGPPSSGTWDFNIRKVDVAREYLEVVAHDVEASESKLVAAVDTATDWGFEAARLAVELTPLIGSLIMLGEAVVGKSISGKDLSRGERAVLGVGALLAEVGALISAGRTAVAASRLSEAVGIPAAQALRMCWAARTLTEAERGLLAQLAGKVRGGAALTAKEVVLLNRLLGKLAEVDRAIAIRSTIQATTGEATKAGRFTNLSSRAAASEIATGQALARDLSADVVRIAEDATASGAKNPDYLINNVLAELVALETSSAAKSPIASALTKIIDKHRQAGIVIVDLTKSVVTAPDLIGSADRLWGNPRFLDVTKLVVVRAGQVIGVIERPVSILEPLLSTGTKAATKTGGTAQ